jgi:hypothetical protein
MKTFMCEGDVDGVDMATIAFDKIQLGITADAMVTGSITRMQHILNDEPNHEIVGPFGAMNANNRPTKSRKLAYIPFDIMELVLGAELTMKQSHELLVHILLHTDYTSICAPLVDFLTVALVQPSATNTVPLTL